MYITRYPILDVYNVGVTSMRQSGSDMSSPRQYYGYYAFDPSKSTVNEAIGNAWVSQPLGQHNQRIWAKFVVPFVAINLRYANYHDTESPSTFDPAIWARSINDGAYEGSIWASNIQPDAYGTYEELTQLWEGKFERHSIYNVPDFHSIDLSTNGNPYQYYIIDVNNNYTGNSGIGFRRLEWQEDV